MKEQEENCGELLGTFVFSEVETKYPFHQVRTITRSEDGLIYNLPAGVMFEDGIDDKDDFKVTIYEHIEADEDGKEYTFYNCFDEGENAFSMMVYDDGDTDNINNDVS